jgi:hypothetical protein
VLEGLSIYVLVQTVYFEEPRIQVAQFQGRLEDFNRSASACSRAAFASCPNCE